MAGETGKVRRDNLIATGEAVHNHEAATEALSDLVETAELACRDKILFARTVRVGPYRVRLRSTSTSAGAFFSHCLTPADGSSAPDLDIMIRVGPAPPSWNFQHTNERHLERLHLSGVSSLAAIYNHERRFWSVLDETGRRGLFWIDQFQDIPFWEQAAPFKTLFGWFLANKPDVLVHAGAVGLDGRGIVLVGKGGSGKSTTVAASVAIGLGTSGDDIIMLSPSHAGWRAHGLYDALKLEERPSVPAPAAIDKVPSVPCGTKRLIRFSDIGGGSFAASLTIDRLLACEVRLGEKSQIEPMSASAMLRVLAPSTLFLLRGREAEALAKINRLVRETSCGKMVIGGSPDEAARYLRNILESGLTR